MKNNFTKKGSYSLLKTNPKLTGNLKMVVDSKGNIYIETIDGSPELSRNKFKAVKLDEQNSWSSSIYKFFSGGNITEEVFYSVKENEDFLSIKTDYSKQYYTNYQQGAFPKISKFYDEQLSYFAPIWLEPNDVPDYFAIFKIPEPVSINTKNQETSSNNDIEKQIYNTNYLENEEESNYFYETILSNAKLHKVFDLGPDSILGSYLRKHINDKNLPINSLTIDWNKDRKSTVNGISLKKSGFTSESFNVFDEAFPIDRTITEFDNKITNTFKDNSVVHANIINLEFLFDDETDDEYTVNRYFGVYFNKNDISEFKLDGPEFYYNRYNDIQNRVIESIYDIDILNDDNIILENQNGIKLYADYEDNYKLLSSDVKGGNFLPYVFSTDCNFFDINNNVDWDENQVVLKDTKVNTNEFKGFTKDSIGIIPSAKTNKEGRSYFEFQILGTTNSFELRLRNVNEYNTNFNLNQVFVGDVSLEKGTFINNKFSLAGNPQEIASAIVRAIRNYSDVDEDFNIYAINKLDKVIIFTRGTNQYWNNYEYLIYSDDNNFDNVVSIPDVEFIDLIEYNTIRNESGIGEFLDYNTLVVGATSMFASNEFFITQSTFKGGNDEPNSRIRVPIEFKDYYKLEYYLKTKDWYSKIDSICSYLDEPVFQNGRLVDFNNFDSYITINCSDDIFITSGAKSELYEIESNKIGLMSLYPIKQFDIDQFRSDYGKDGDGFIEKLRDNYLLKAGATTIDNIDNNIQNFIDTGFKRLGGELNEDTGEISTIENEYDRLKENELPELSIKGRIIPYINKWVYDDESVDVRENNYRLTSNSAFSYDNFSPSSENKLADFRFYTHEWYYLQEYPQYMTLQEKLDSFSYFDRYLDISELYDVENDNFIDYFTQYKIDDTYFPKRDKYSIIDGGTIDSFAETFFRGAKIRFKKRIENKKTLNFNIENIGVYKDNYFNQYKFSAILTNKTEDALKYTIVENKKFKNITFFIEANLDDYYLNRGGATGNDLFLDRSSLYVIEDKYDENGEFADIKVSGAISPYIEDEGGNQIPNFRIDINGNYVINGLQNLTNNSIPNFNKQIIPSENGSYNTIEFTISDFTSNKLIISGIKSVTKTTITASRFVFSVGYAEYPITLTYNTLFPIFSVCVNRTPIYLKGGYNTYKGLIQDISFASIVDKVNNGSPDISYITINEDGTTTSNTFLVEFEKYSINAKADYIGVEPIIFNGLKNSNFQPIGSRTTALNNTYFSTMFRYNGRYNPKVKDVMLYSDDFGSKFNEEIRDKLLFSNVQFFSTYPGFALYKQLYINKINEQNPLTILDLNKETALKPEFWKIGEITLDKLDFYIFRSCWDYNFHRRYDSKVRFTNFPGYIEPKEVSTMMGSTIMNILDEIVLEKYTFSDVILNTDFEITLTRNDNNNISGTLNNTTKIINELKPKILPLFEKYVNPLFNFRELDTLEDDVERYIIQNILPRYFTNNVYAYYKFSNISSNSQLIENGKTEQELLLDGFLPLKNINFNKVNGNEFDVDFTYIKPSDRNVTLAFFTKVIIL